MIYSYMTTIGIPVRVSEKEYRLMLLASDLSHAMRRSRLGLQIQATAETIREACERVARSKRGPKVEDDLDLASLFEGFPGTVVRRG